MCEHEPERNLVRRSSTELARIPERLFRIVELVEERAAEHDRADLVQPVLEGDDDAEVAGASAQAPEEVRVLGLGRGHESPVSGDEIDGEQIVDRQTVLAGEPADSAAERQAGDSGVRDLAAGQCEAVRLRLAVEVAPQRTCLCACDLGIGVDPDALHAREVEDDPVAVE